MRCLQDATPCPFKSLLYPFRVGEQQGAAFLPLLPGRLSEAERVSGDFQGSCAMSAQLARVSLTTAAGPSTRRRPAETPGVRRPGGATSPLTSLRRQSRRCGAAPAAGVLITAGLFSRAKVSQEDWAGGAYA